MRTRLPMFCKGPVKWVLSSPVLRASISELIFGKCSGGMLLPCPRELFTGGIMTAMSVTVFYAQAIPATEPIPGAFINLDLLVASRPVKVSLEKNAMMAPSYIIKPSHHLPGRQELGLPWYP
ncbi:hypothetical protein GOP47_0029493 [Adiantum capillus-veneris]|nr:hypothetical protein GOP47_0029493 [Adiantum capillus-veneris]